MPDIRDALAGAAQALLLAAATDAGSNVFLWRDWPLASDKLPAIVIKARRLSRADLSGGNGPPHYAATVVLEVECHTDSAVDALTAETAARTLEQQCDPVIQGIIIGPPQTFRRIALADSDIDVTSEGKRHNGTAELRYHFETAERFFPVVTETLQRVRLIALKQGLDSGAIAAIEAALPSATDAQIAALKGVLAGADFAVPTS